MLPLNSLQGGIELGFGELAGTGSDEVGIQGGQGLIGTGRESGSLCYAFFSILTAQALSSNGFTPKPPSSGKLSAS